MKVLQAQWTACSDRGWRRWIRQRAFLPSGGRNASPFLPRQERPAPRLLPTSAL